MSPNGAYSISTADAGITLKGPRGTVTLTNDGFQIQPSPGMSGQVPIKVNTVGCARQISPGAFVAPGPVALGDDTWNWTLFGSGFDPDPSPHDHRLTHASSFTVCP